MALKKPSDIFGNKSKENNIPVVESDRTLRDELNKVESLSEQVTQLQQQLSQKVVKSDLESLVLSQINTMQENFEYLQNYFKKSNKKDIVEFKERVSELTEIVGNLVENELPKYKKQVTKNEVRIGDKFDELKEVVKENIVDIRGEIDTKVNDIVEVIDDNLEFFNNKLQETSSEVKKTTNTYNKLSKILENKVSQEKDRNDLYINDKFDELKEVVEENIVGIKRQVDNNLEYFNNQFQENSSEVKKTTDTYNKLSKILENKVSKENDKLEEYSQVIQSLHEAFLQLDKSLQEKTSTHQKVIEEVIEEKFETISSVVTNRIDSIGEEVTNRIGGVGKEVDTFKNKVLSEVSNIKADVVIFEKHNKDTEKTIKEFSEQLSEISKIDESIEELNEDIDKLQNQYDEVYNQSTETKKDLEIVERYIQNHHQDIIELKEEVFAEIEQIPVGNIQENLERLEKKIDYIKETYSKIDSKVIVKEVIKEGILNEPRTTKNSDTLTPLDQKFVTLDQLQKHYSLFINRIQQQLSTLGGGGETKLKYLDDIVGIATNASAYDGKYLKYNHSFSQFEFSDVDISNDSWADGALGPYTLSSVGIGTTNPTSKLHVVGDTLVTGVTTTTRLIVNPIGSGTTFTENLVVEGSARVTGILSIGTGTITLDPENNAIVLGDVMMRRDPSTGDIKFSHTDGSLSNIMTNNVIVGSGNIQSGVLTTSSTSPVVVMSLNASTYRSVQYQVQVTEGTNYNMTIINLIHDGVDTYMSEYGTVNQPIGVATFSSDIDSGAIRLIGYSTFARNTTFKVICTAIES